jgi:hypothetical protein
LFHRLEDPHQRKFLEAYVLFEEFLKELVSIMEKKRELQSIPAKVQHT